MPVVLTGLEGPIHQNQRDQGSDEGALRIPDCAQLGKNFSKKRFPHRFLPSSNALFPLHAVCQTVIICFSATRRRAQIIDTYWFTKLLANRWLVMTAPTTSAI
jgi:hypothetical protein